MMLDGCAKAYLNGVDVDECVHGDVGCLIISFIGLSAELSPAQGIQIGTPVD